MHRLQHLLHRRPERNSDPLHPEPHHGRRVAARLAPGTHSREGLRPDGARRRRWTGGPRSGGLPRAPRLQVALAEAGTELGGRVSRESALPGLAEWARVRDWRIAQLNQLANVEIFLASELDAQQILEFGADRVALATGSAWRRDGTGRWHEDPVGGWEAPHVLTPDDVMAGATPKGPVIVFDDDHYYMGGVIAEKLRHDGVDVLLVTPAGDVSAWTHHTDEQMRIQARVIEVGVRIKTGTVLESISDESAVLACAYTGRTHEVEAAGAVMVTSRSPRIPCTTSSARRSTCPDRRLPRAGHHRHRRLLGAPLRARDGRRSPAATFPSGASTPRTAGDRVGHPRELARAASTLAAACPSAAKERRGNAPRRSRRRRPSRRRRRATRRPASTPPYMSW